MKTVTMLEFRQHAEKIITQVRKGQAVILTRRGKPVARLEPIEAEAISADDPFYSITDLAQTPGESLSNKQIDHILYGQ